LRLEANLYGLLPLFPVSLYTSVDDESLLALKNSILENIDSAAAMEAAPDLPNNPLAKYEGPGFSSPDDAAKSYLEGLRRTDLSGMVGAFAVESIVGNADFNAILNRYRVYPSPPIIIPNTNGFTTSLNVESYKAGVVEAIAAQYQVLCSLESGQGFPENQKIEDADAASELAANIKQILDAPKPGTIEVLGFIPPDELSGLSSFLGGLEIDDSYFDKGIQDMLTQHAAMYGVDNVSGCIAVFEVNADLYLLCLDAVEYSGKWYISELGGRLASFMFISPSWRGLVPLSVMGVDTGVDAAKIRELVSK
jgi:hypothetical protein